jgi:hypothetical protein
MVGTGEIGKPHSSAMSSGVFAAIAHAFSSALEAIINFAGQFFTGKSLENRRTKVEAKEKLTFDFSDKEETANALRKAFGAITPQQYGNMLLRGSKNINFNVDDAGQMTANVEYFDNTTPSDKNLSVDSIREARIFDENMGDPADYRATKMGILAAIDGTQAEGNLTRRNVSVVIGGRELCKKNADGSYNENFWLEVTKALRDFVEEKCAGKSEDEKEKFMLHVLQALCGACKGPNPILGWLVCRGLKSFAAAGDTACIQADLDENTGKYLKITIGDTGVECEQTSRRQVSLQKGIRSTELPFFLLERLKTWTSFNDTLMRKIDTSSGVTI